MHKNIIYPILSLLIGTALAGFASYTPDHSNALPPAPDFVAHAGGAVDGETYLNTIEALDLNYARGFRFFELDFSWTSDRVPVGVHDWGQTYKRLFIDHSSVPNLASFKKQDMKNGSTPVTFELLDQWLVAHADAWIISDFKNENLNGLRWIKDNFPDVADRVIPQIYDPGEYNAVEMLGYQDMILTIYRLPQSADQNMVSFAQENDLFALTLPAYRFEQLMLNTDVLNTAMPICVHTINDADKWLELKDKGAKCVYTDELISDS